MGQKALPMPIQNMETLFQDDYPPINLKPYGRMVMVKKQQQAITNSPRAENLQKSHHLRML